MILQNELEPTSGLGIIALSATLTDRAKPSKSLKATVAWQVGLGDSRLDLRLVATADGVQLTPDETTTAHHFANVLFNIMRGGIFADNYQVQRDAPVDCVRVYQEVS